MAQISSADFSLHITNNVQYNVYIRNDVSQSDDNSITISSYRQAIFAFAVTAFLSFIQVKYSGKDGSPIETHPKTMVAAITNLIVYCWAYNAWLKNPRHPSSTSFYTSNLLVGAMAFSRSLALASLLSIIFPESLGPFLYSLSILFPLVQCFAPHIQTLILNWLRKAAYKILGKLFRQSHRYQRTTTVSELILVQIPRVLPNAIEDQVHLLPV